MKSSVVVPVVLIVCLLALALLISQAFTATEAGDVVPQDSGTYSNSPNTVAEDTFDFTDPQTDRSAAGELVPSDLTPATEAGGDGDYFVIAGTFRQEINARTRVRDLRQAGFSTTELSRFDRGTYAVALVDHTKDFNAADALAERVRTAGFEAKVYRKR